MEGKRAASRWGHAAERRRAIEEYLRTPKSLTVLPDAPQTVACVSPCGSDTDPWASYALSEHDRAELWALLQRLERRGEVV